MRSRLWLLLPLVGCSSASEPAPPLTTHDVIEVAVAVPPPSDELALPREQKLPSAASARVSALAASATAFEDVPVSRTLGGMPSSAVRGPAGPVRAGSAEVKLLATFGGKIDNAAPVVAGMAAGFRRCYRRGLADAPSSAGRVQILTKIGPKGEVLSASPNTTGSLAGSVLSCIAARVSSAQFAPPSKTPSTLTISVVLTPN